MKPIYCIEIYQYDYCNSWTEDVLHTTNKKYLDDLCAKLEKNYGTKDTISFSVKEIKVPNNPTKQDVEQVKSYFGFIFS